MRRGVVAGFVALRPVGVLVAEAIVLCDDGAISHGEPSAAIVVGMVAITRVYADGHGDALFEDVDVPLLPEDPSPDVLSVSEPWPASAVLFGRGPAGGSHPEQPEHRRQLIVVVSGTVEVTATGETRTFRPGDVLLVEDTTGVGHSSRSAEGFVGVVVQLEPAHA